MNQQQAAQLPSGFTPPPPGLSGPRLQYPRDESAYQLGISVRSLDYCIAKKEIAIRRVGKKILITHAELLKFTKKDHDSVATNGTEEYDTAEDTHYTN